MSYDFLGQMFGKARRRKIEAAAMIALTGGTKPVAIDYGVLGTRIATAATVYLLGATLNHTLPATAGGILTGLGAAVVAAGPSALQSSGVMSALSPNTVSAIKGLGQTVSAVLAAPANAKKAAFQTAVATEVQNVLEKKEQEKTGQFGPGDLATPSTAAPTSQSPAETPTSAQTATVAAFATEPDQAIQLVGGNQ